MILHDAALRKAVATGSLEIEPFDSTRVQPSSIDLTLGQQFCALRHSPDAEVLDVKVDNRSRFTYTTVCQGGCIPIMPGQFLLGATRETVRLSGAYAGRIEGKSSLGRLGLMVHSTAGFVDPGFEGQITLELSNLTEVPITLYPGMPVAQLAVFLMAGTVELPYGRTGKYQGQTGPTPSKYHLNFGAGDRVS